MVKIPIKSWIRIVTRITTKICLCHARHFCKKIHQNLTTIFLGHRANRKTNGGKTYKCFSSWLTQQGDTRGHRKKLCKPLCKISAFIAGIYCHRVNFNIWNALPDIVVTAPSATSVKKRLCLCDDTGHPKIISINVWIISGKAARHISSLSTIFQPTGPRHLFDPL